ncbi:MerR family transcriptional regulator [Streptomyces kunmingensis]|uniref:MerR family transcriptional regulator n=1 Tax=Streptomyces kunmingensis TaxID=68225 RepID=A0ABU6CDY6_9ACTN|nr:MerR family transcriptional regulator [Streptomyces kunmingensis]MEB3962674.1 MerR family transcriptional regulator [Streptomyces kunmingensis]
MRIGEVAAAAGVSTRALRYYEQQRLITSSRSAGGQRLYTPDAVQRVRWIQALYAAGLSSQTIAEFLPCAHTGVVTPEMVARLRSERARIDHHMRELAATRAQLDAVLAATCEPGTVWPADGGSGT